MGGTSHRSPGGSTASSWTAGRSWRRRADHGRVNDRDRIVPVGEWAGFSDRRPPPSRSTTALREQRAPRSVMAKTLVCALTEKPVVRGRTVALLAHDTG